MVHQLNVQLCSEKLLQLYHYADENLPWTQSFPTLQSGISVSKTAKDDLLKACGGGFTQAQEKLYDQFHDHYQNTYLSELSSLLQLKIYRLRWMKLSAKSCYSFHQDGSRRLHIPIITSKESYILFQNPLELVHLETMQAYIVDTTRVHTAINTGMDVRVHLVACIED